MGKTLTCPFCNNKDTLKVVYCYRGYKKRNNDDISNLIKDGTIYRNEKPRFEKYDFDGEKITASLYNKYCPNCDRYFHSIGKMAVIDIDKVTFIYSLEKLDINPSRLMTDRKIFLVIKVIYYLIQIWYNYIVKLTWRKNRCI